MAATPSDPTIVCLYTGTVGQFATDAASPVSATGVFTACNSGVTNLHDALAAGFMVSAPSHIGHTGTATPVPVAHYQFAWTLTADEAAGQPTQIMVLYSDPSIFNADVGAWLYLGWTIATIEVSEHFGRDVFYVCYAGAFFQQVPPDFLGIIPVYNG